MREKAALVSVQMEHGAHGLITKWQCQPHLWHIKPWVNIHGRCWQTMLRKVHKCDVGMRKDGCACLHSADEGLAIRLQEWPDIWYFFLLVRTNNIFDLTHCNLVRNLSDDRLLLRALLISMSIVKRMYHRITAVTSHNPIHGTSFLIMVVHQPSSAWGFQQP